MMQNPRFESRFGGPPRQMVIATPPTKGTLHARVRGLIGAIQRELLNFDEGGTVFYGYLIPIKDNVQDCLLDIGDLAQEELRAIDGLDFGPSQGLARWYQRGVYNGFEVKEGDPSEFLRLQKEYDQATSPKLRGMIALLERVRSKLLGRGSVPAAPPAEPATTNAAAQIAPVTSEPTPRRGPLAGLRLVKPFAAPDGSTWRDVTIRFTSDFQVQISVRDYSEVRTYIEMGFEDRRGKRSSKPDRNWAILRRFGEHDGAIRSTQEADEWPKLEKGVQTINRRLSQLFGLSGRPINYERRDKAYRARAKFIAPREKGDPD